MRSRAISRVGTALAIALSSNLQAARSSSELMIYVVNRGNDLAEDFFYRAHDLVNRADDLANCGGDLANRADFFFIVLTI